MAYLKSSRYINDEKKKLKHLYGDRITCHTFTIKKELSV